jgi:hypothetical protein
MDNLTKTSSLSVGAVNGHQNQIVINNYYGVSSAQLLELFEIQRKQIESLLKLAPQIYITSTVIGGSGGHAASKATGNTTEITTSSDSTSNANNHMATPGTKP